MSVRRAEPGDPATIPRSVAIIMDGNGRWAKRRKLARIRGHEHGTTAVREAVEECARLGVEALTLYTFSEENWTRPQREIDLLMKLLEKFLIKELPTLMKNDVRLVHAGRTNRLPAKTLDLLRETVDKTAANEGLVLCLALSYGGRAELVDATRALAREVRDGTLDPDAIDEQAISDRLYCPQLPHPDLLIRTAGEMRVSNFLLWQISYAEFYVVEDCWPDFRRPHLHAAFEEFGKRQRKFGAVLP